MDHNQTVIIKTITYNGSSANEGTTHGSSQKNTKRFADVLYQAVNFKCHPFFCKGVSRRKCDESDLFCVGKANINKWRVLVSMV